MATLYTYSLKNWNNVDLLEKFEVQIYFYLLCEKGCLMYLVNTSPNDKILGLSKLKPFADDKVNDMVDRPVL